MTIDIKQAIEKLKQRHPCIVTDKLAIGNLSELYTDVFDDFEQTLHHQLQKAYQQGFADASVKAGVLLKDTQAVYEAREGMLKDAIKQYDTQH